MIELYLPYLIGLTIGIAPPGGPGTAPTIAPADVPAASVAAPDTTGRAPEDQTPTGQFTTANEVKPILGMTQGNWVAVRNYEGQDLLYFTHLMSWRCGLWGVRYGLNGAPADQPLAMEPCHVDSNAPNSMTMVEDFLPYIALPENAVASVTVEVTYDDGSQEAATFQRADIQID